MVDPQKRITLARAARDRWPPPHVLLARQLYAPSFLALRFSHSTVCSCSKQIQDPGPHKQTDLIFTKSIEILSVENCNRDTVFRHVMPFGAFFLKVNE